MKQKIAKDPSKRLIQINEWVTKIIYSANFFYDAQWLPVRMNIDKWKSQGFEFVNKVQPDNIDFTKEELMHLYYIGNALSEIMLMEKEIQEAAQKQQFEKAALYRDIAIDCRTAFTYAGANTNIVLRLFVQEENKLILKCMDNFFIQNHIKTCLRL